MIDFQTLLLIIWLHWFADFVMQTDAMAKGKSKSFGWLGYHVAVYSLFMIPLGLTFAVINGILHGVVDYFTSRESSKRWAKGEVHNFFVVIGFDQALHMTCLVGTWILLKG
jgi:hypothetical protein